MRHPVSTRSTRAAAPSRPKLESRLRQTAGEAPAPPLTSVRSAVSVVFDDSPTWA